MLSTNWKDIGKKKTECTPPSGMEAKRYRLPPPFLIPLLLPLIRLALISGPALSHVHDSMDWIWYWVLLYAVCIIMLHCCTYPESPSVRALQVWKGVINSNKWRRPTYAEMIIQKLDTMSGDLGDPCCVLLLYSLFCFHACAIYIFCQAEQRIIALETRT